MKQILLLAAVATVSATAFAARASEVIIPPAANTAQVAGVQLSDFQTTGGFTIESGPGPVTSSFELNPSGSFSYLESASVVLNPQPTLTTSIIGTSIQPSNSSTQSLATSTYYFSINGPSSIMVPVLVQANISSDLTGDPASVGWLIDANVMVQSTVSGSAFLGPCTPGDGVCSLDQFAASPMALDEVVDFASNALTEVQMSAGIRVFNDVPGTPYSGSLTVDPIFTIDPSFLAANPGYSLSFSSGVGDSALSGAPEPATWALMLAGFGGLGATLRRRRAVLA